MKATSNRTKFNANESVLASFFYFWQLIVTFFIHICHNFWQPGVLENDVWHFKWCFRCSTIFCVYFLTFCYLNRDFDSWHVCNNQCYTEIMFLAFNSRGLLHVKLLTFMSNVWHSTIYIVILTANINDTHQYQVFDIQSSIKIVFLAFNCRYTCFVSIINKFNYCIAILTLNFSDSLLISRFNIQFYIKIVFSISNFTICPCNISGTLS